MAEETYDDPSADPGDGSSEYTYGGGTGDYERGDGPGTDGLEDTDFEDDGVLDSSDTLEDSEDPYEDPLNPGVEPADKWSAGERFGDTLAEERQGESLDQLLAEEDPEPDPYADPDPQAESDLPREGPESYDERQPRAGWWPRMREPTQTLSRTSSPRTWASTGVARAPKRRQST